MASAAALNAATVVGTNYDANGLPSQTFVRFVSTSTPSAMANGGINIGVDVVVVPNTNGVYQTNLLAGSYYELAGPWRWTIAVPDTTSTINIKDIITSGPVFYNYSNLTSIYGVKCSSIDTTADFLTNKIIAGNNISVGVTNNGANEQIWISSTASGGGTGIPTLNGQGTNTSFSGDFNWVDNTGNMLLRSTNGNVTIWANTLTSSGVLDLRGFTVGITASPSGGIWLSNNMYFTNAIYLKERAVSSSGSTAPADNIVLLTSSGLTETLTTAVGNAGRVVTYKLTVSGTGTIATTSSQTIDGATTYSLSAQYKYVTVISDGANWSIIANN